MLPEGVLRHVDADGRTPCQAGCPLSATLADGSVVGAVEVVLEEKMVATTLARSARALDFVGRWKGEEAGDVLKRADSLMYEAKAAGRNRVVVRL